ncbi:MAG: putative sulfate exporter family transporter [Leptolyngbya sp. UWPOB_LEPTO1]|nr:putative sulfate exporter family transporter [Leptolyngbya sp. UWPOB_LEPTO1]
MRHKTNNIKPFAAIKIVTAFQGDVFSQAIAQIKISLVKIQSGVWLVCGLTAIAYLLRLIPGFTLFSPLILAILLGILVQNTIGVAPKHQAGIHFAMRRILRFAVILLGVQLSLLQVLSVGITGLLIIIATLLSTFWLTCWVGQHLGVSPSLTRLIAAGTSICGASAVIATSTTTESGDEDITYAIGIVTLFGTVSMLLYPLLSGQLNLTPEAFGLWCGVSIHEVAQVLAAAFQVNSVSGEIASISKLSRVLWLVPMMLMLGAISKAPQSKSRITIPWFVVYFMLLILLNSLNLIPQQIKTMTGQVNQFLLTISMAAMGLETRLNQIQKIGLRPLYLGALSWLFISISSYGLIQILY